MVAELYLRLGMQAKGQECYGYLFDRLRDKNDVQKAVLVFRKLLKIGPQEPPRFMDFARLLERAKPAEAANVYQTAADLFRKQNNLNGAVDAIGRLVALDPASADLQCLLAETAAEARQNDVAATAWLRAAELQRRQPGTQGEASSVLPLVERAHQMSPQDRAIALSLAQLLVETGKGQRAADLLRPFAASPGVPPELLRTLGEACVSVGDAQGAESALGPLVSTMPDAPRLLVRAAERYLEANEPDLAMSLLERVKNALAHSNKTRELASLVDAIPDTLGASEAFLEFQARLYSELQQDDKLGKALARLFDLHFAERSFMKAADALDRLVPLDPYDPEGQKRLQMLNGKIDASRWQSISAASGASTSSGSAGSGKSAFGDGSSFSKSKRRDWRDLVEDEQEPSGGSTASSRTSEASADRDADDAAEASILEDLMLQAEIFLQYGLAGKAVERLERVNKLFPGEEESNEKLRSLYAAAGVHVQASAPKAVKSATADEEDAQVDFGHAGEIIRNITRQGTVKNVLFTAINDIGRTWHASKCVASLCTPGKTPSALLEFCGSGMKQSDAMPLVKLIHGALKLAADGTPQTIEDAESSPKLTAIAPIIKALGIKSLVVVPMMEADQLTGVLILEQCDRRRKWRPSEVQVLKTITDQMVMAASHVKLRSLMKSLAVTDERTGMLTRAAYIDCLLAELGRMGEQGGEMSVALVQFGRGSQLSRDAGEEVLRKFMDEAGMAMASHLRQNDVAIRYDSTTLALVMPGTKGGDGMQVMEKMRRIVGGMKISDKVPPFTYGVAQPLIDAETDAVDSVTELINRAEWALEEAHKEGGNGGKLLEAQF